MLKSIQDGKYRMLDPEDTVFLMIDHQAGLMLFPKDIDPLTLRSNSIALAFSMRRGPATWSLTALSGVAIPTPTAPAFAL